ncbi:Retrotransposable element Tf2 [Sesbania bispinosa]|nr:Retrotransposable element Tf2 [Sesbania bispinosa]
MGDRWRRLEIPLFSGDDAYGWVNRVERYFNLKGVLEQERLQAVKVAMEGKALSWFRWWKFCNSNPLWEDFKAVVINRIQPQFDLDIWVQEEGSESWEKEYRGKNEALKFKNHVGREEAIHKEVEQVKETNIKIVVAEKEMETELELYAGTAVEVQEADVADKIEGEESNADWGNIKTKKGCFKEVITIRFGNSEVSDKRPPPEPPDWVACVVFETTPAEQIVAGSVLQAIRMLCKTFKQKLEAGLGEAFKGSWLQEGLRGFTFDPGGTWFSAATSYSP